MTVYKMVRFTDEEAFGNKERPPSNVTELIQQRDAAIRDRDAARQSRARLVQLFNERGISTRSWHAAERTWKP